MIEIDVNQDLDLITNLAVLDAQDNHYHIEAMIDTGFNDSLTRDRTTISQLGFTWHGVDLVTVADGRMVACDTFAAKVEWDGAERKIYVQEADTVPLIRTELLRGFNLSADFVPGGTETLDRI